MLKPLLRNRTKIENVGCCFFESFDDCSLINHVRLDEPSPVAPPPMRGNRFTEVPGWEALGPDGAVGLISDFLRKDSHLRIKHTQSVCVHTCA